MPSSVHRYEELRLRIETRSAHSYRVHASSRSADASSDFKMPFNELELENFVLRAGRTRGRRRIDSSALGDAKRFGGALFKALFQDDVAGLYHEALGSARGKNSGLRITLCLSESPELMNIPWEYLYDEPDFLAASAFTPVVRYLDLARGHRPLRVAPPLRILGVVSSPSDYEQLDTARERANLERAVAGLVESGSVELHWLERPTLSALLKRLQDDTFHVLHYVGHGSYDDNADEGLLLFEDEQGRARPVTGDKLGMIVHDFTSLRLAVLNACEGARTAKTDPFAGVAQALVQRDIPAVVAMQFEISDDAAVTFAGGFYDALATGAPADASLATARLAMLAAQSDDIEWGTPVLFMRVPDGKLFDVGKRRHPARAATAVLEVAPPVQPAVKPADSTKPPHPGQTSEPTSEPTSEWTHEPDPRVTYRARRLRAPRWLAVPGLALIAALIFVLASPSPAPSNTSVVRSWLTAFDQRDFSHAVGYWFTPAAWTGLGGQTNDFNSLGQLKSFLRARSACHKLLSKVAVDPSKPNLVQLRIVIDGALPGLPISRCGSIGQLWYETYSVVSGHIDAVKITRITSATVPAGARPTKSSTPTSAGARRPLATRRRAAPPRPRARLPPRARPRAPRPARPPRRRGTRERRRSARR